MTLIPFWKRPANHKHTYDDEENDNAISSTIVDPGVQRDPSTIRIDASDAKPNADEAETTTSVADRQAG